MSLNEEQKIVRERVLQLPVERWKPVMKKDGKWFGLNCTYHRTGVYRAGSDHGRIVDLSISCGEFVGRCAIVTVNGWEYRYPGDEKLLALWERLNQVHFGLEDERVRQKLAARDEEAQRRHVQHVRDLDERF